jgi:transcriptional regulator with XRE-family HTH domain
VRAARWPEAAAVVREMIADGSLGPGDLAPSALFLAARTGACEDTCRKGLRLLVEAGVLDAAVSRSGRPRVPGGDGPGQGERILAAALARMRRDAGLTQAELARKAGVKLTSVGRAEAGRLPRSPQVWARLDTALGAGGLLARARELLELASAGRAGDEGPEPRPGPQDAPLLQEPHHGGDGVHAHPGLVGDPLLGGEPAAGRVLA